MEALDVILLMIRHVAVAVKTIFMHEMSIIDRM